MSQSEVIVGALFAGFVVWLAMNKKLATYWSLLMGGGASGGPGAGGAAAPSGGTTATGGAQLPQPGSSGAPWLIPPAPSIGFPGLSLPPNPFTTPEPGTGFGSFN